MLSGGSLCVSEGVLCVSLDVSSVDIEIGVPCHIPFEHEA